LIFGANTDVGKTVVSAGLARASDDLNRTTSYIKPLQSGGSDEEFIRFHNPNLSYSRTLFKFDAPASPHLASRQEDSPVSDKQVLDALFSELGASKAEVTWIETAGGVLSPGPSSPSNQNAYHAMNAPRWGWVPQANLYQPLIGQVQVVLIGDGRLGGISATLSAIESLLVRGYDISAVVIVDGDVTAEALQEYVSRTFSLRSGSGEAVQPRVVSLPRLPPLPDPLDSWFEANHGSFLDLENYLHEAWGGQVSDLDGLLSQGSDVLWWPFTQHRTIDRVTMIDSSVGDNYSVLERGRDGVMSRRFLFDACASWWTQGLGHGETTLSLASAAAAGRYGHVIFPQVCHAPAVTLAQKLLEGPGKGWANRVFFSDDGSTAIEVAIKMGMKLYQKRVGAAIDHEDDIDWVICAQEGCYHGDTLGAMNVAEPSIFNEGQHPWYQPKGLFLETPTFGFRDGDLILTLPECYEPSFAVNRQFESIEQLFDVEARMLTSLFSHYKEMIEMQWLVYEHSGVNRKISSVVIEPILMGAGGMKMIDPLWQRALMAIAKSRIVPVIFDEVLTGLYRLGVKSCREFLKDDPDIACYAKLLTGGLLPMGVTLATGEVFDSFLGDDKGQALLHGHSYTANPVGCVTAIHALDSLDASQIHSEHGLSLFDLDQARELSCLPHVETSVTLGSVLAVALVCSDGVGGYGASSSILPVVAEKLLKEGIYCRPLGNVIYIMVSPMTSREECSRLTCALHRAIASSST
jgi:dethiobiotin synthetase/adenosylmethionine--8-amino-7-oxononanoate aminotransferase